MIVDLKNIILFAKNVSEKDDFYYLTGEKIKSDISITFDLNPEEHEKLQTEVYTHINNGMLTYYKSQPVFEISLFNVKLIFKKI